MNRPTDALRAIVEPAWHRIDEYMYRGLRGPITVPIHDHAGSQRDEGEVAVDLMQRMDVDCGNIGYHRHTVAVPSDDLRTVSRNSDTVPHHHHDLRCLVDAGVESVRPRVRDLEARLESQVSQTRHLRSRVDAAQAAQAVAERRAQALAKSVADVVAFMESMPAVGPWKTVYDQYNAWMDESLEEETHAQSA